MKGQMSTTTTKTSIFQTVLWNPLFTVGIWRTGHGSSQRSWSHLLSTSTSEGTIRLSLNPPILQDTWACWLVFIR